MGKLTDAVKKGDVPEVRKLLDEEYKVSSVNNKINLETDATGNPPLMVAVLGELTEIVEVLVKAGAKLDLPNKTGLTPLHMAAQKGHIDTIQALLKAGAKVDISNEKGTTPLRLAAELGHVAAVEALLKAGAKIDQALKDGSTPFLAAAQNGHTAMVQALLKVGTKINHTIKNGATALYLAALKGHADVIPVLLSAGAKIDQPTNEGATALYIAAQIGHLAVTEALLKGNANVDHTMKGGETPLLIAAQNGHVDVVQALLKAGAKMNQAIKNGVTPLYAAALKGQVGTIEALIKAGANIDQPENVGGTPLYAAAQTGQVSIVEVLLKGGANINQAASDGATPLFKAVEKGHMSVVQTLLSARAKVDCPLKTGGTALYIAAQLGNVPAIQALLESRANVNKTNDNDIGATPLYVASQLGQTDAVQALLNARASVDKTTLDGSTALLIASHKGHVKTVNALLDGGANKDKPRKGGLTPLQMAWNNNQTEVAELLQTYKFKAKPKAIKSALSAKSPTVEKKLSAERYAESAPQVHAQPLSKDPSGLKVSFSIEAEELTLGKELGSGGFGIVYQGTWKKHVDVAIKQLHVAQFSKELMADFQHEIKIMAQLRGPHVVQLYGACLKAPYCIVMEFMPKGSLYSVLDSKAELPWTQREQIALDMAYGLSFLHEQNIIHRDLKSLNVLLDIHFKAKLSDFGLAAVRTESSSSNKAGNQAAGTLAWMAPELFSLQAVCSKETDIYSFGMTLWELASREIPFKDAQNRDLIPAWIAEGEREDIPEDTPPKVAKLITFCWDAKAAKRPSADEVIKALKTEKNAEAVPASLLASGPLYLENSNVPLNNSEGELKAAPALSSKPKLPPKPVKKKVELKEDPVQLSPKNLSKKDSDGSVDSHNSDDSDGFEVVATSSNIKKKAK